MENLSQHAHTPKGASATSQRKMSGTASVENLEEYLKRYNNKGKEGTEVKY